MLGTVGRAWLGIITLICSIITVFLYVVSFLSILSGWTATPYMAFISITGSVLVCIWFIDLFTLPAAVSRNTHRLRQKLFAQYTYSLNPTTLPVQIQPVPNATNHPVVPPKD